MDRTELAEPAAPPQARDGDELITLDRDPTSRKRFLKMAGGVGAGGMLAAFLAACGEEERPSSAAPAPAKQDMAGSAADSRFGKGDLGILNYALTLEYLEAEFYDQAIKSGKVTDRKIAAVAKEIRSNENEHVDALIAAVKKAGGKPAAKPRTDFTSVIDGGAETILATAAKVENVGAAAYLGQAGFIKDKAVLAAALSIHSVEAEHAAALNQVAGNGFQKSSLEGALPDGAFAKPLTMDQVLREVQPFLA